MASLNAIPSIYWIQLACVDPILSFGTMFAAIFAPDVLLATFFPEHLITATPFPPLYHAILHQLGAWYLFHAILSGVALRATRDRNVWKISQAATLAVDTCILWDFYASVVHQGRIDPRAWTMGELAGVVYTVWVWVVRAAFLAGVGLPGTRDVGDGAAKKRL
ncbi:hypothetical protein MAPG_01230 [Magnaporthiopsis poae ATCC 64411]|uniref:DUF7704 domain-containing protein n=1 Tax=Magnaporthiopsis poae (strain ATCC 64411 / 73-15) TaxID=644358 RepID=A0A0C4DN54_MAGP6|nr:hypothetical protein MAPG_01230 [Magnaporthiopsis poae ATCC 64411]